MAGIFPSPTGVPPEDADNSYVPANAPIGGPPRFYGRECQTTLYAWALNALTSEILAAVDRLGFAYNSSRVDNLGAALADVISAIQLDVTAAQNALIALGDRLDDAEADIVTINNELVTMSATLLAHQTAINNITTYLNDLNATQIDLNPAIGGFTNLADFLNAAVPSIGNMPDATIKGNNSGGTGPAMNLTPEQVAAMLPPAAIGAKGLLAALSSNVRQYFDGSGSWSEPPLATPAARGTIPPHPNDSTQVLRGNNSWGSIPSLDAGTGGIFFGPTAPVGWLKANGAATSLIVYPSLIAIYCGDANNPTVNWGYRCTNPANPTGTRSVTGDYIVLPDGRGEFLRGWDDGRGIDTRRNMWLAQAQALMAHVHGVTDPLHFHYPTYGGVGFDINAGAANFLRPTVAQDGAGINVRTTDSATGISIQSTGGVENRPRNLAPLIIIKY